MYFSKRIIFCLFGLFMFLALVSVQATAADDFFQNVDEYNNLRYGNQYIMIVINQNDNAQGRFAVETTGGAPARENDDDKPLIYGRPNPWTSYTSLWINNEKYVFGGKTERRAGKGAKYGEVIKPPTVEDGNVITTTKFGDVVVEQILTIVKSSTTGLADSAQIKYRITNNGSESEKVGLRIMLDTMLGENDGAPFRLGEDTIDSDKLYYDKQLDDFWQAFDSISDPQVTSQGSFIGPDVTIPDRVYFSDWGSLADGVWDFDFNPGQDFIRKGEYETDSAVAMYWVPEIIDAGATKTYVTKYGLGGITIVPGILSLGVTSAAEVTLDQNNNSFPVVAYLENTSEIRANDVSIKLDLPAGFTADQSVKNIGNMESGGISQLTWNVRPLDLDNLPAEITYRVTADATNTDSNQVERKVKFLGPPVLDADISLMEKVESVAGKLEPNPFRVQAEISNLGESALYGVESELIFPPGLVPAESEKPLKNLGNLQSGESLKVNWSIKALRVEGTLPFALKVSGLNGFEKTIVKEIELPQLNPLIYLKETTGKVDADYYSIDIVAANIGQADNISFDLNYNADKLLLTHVSRGDFFVRNGKFLPFNRPQRAARGSLHFNQDFPFATSNGIIATVHFKLKDPEHGKLSISDLKAVNELGNEIKIKIKNISEEE